MTLRHLFPIQPVVLEQVPQVIETSLFDDPATVAVISISTTAQTVICFPIPKGIISPLITLAINIKLNQPLRYFILKNRKDNKSNSIYHISSMVSYFLAKGLVLSLDLLGF